ncbi:N-acetylmuramoyl-L-alanine amidase [Paracoccus sp. FO-3]|uniref:N-acetylmuramoyl-L-alanine amidase n=1 Tax=Paracoccus sp. FO-3 TaxID=1335059 RepID=UPI001126FE41|nr:N-acetylmuramoyl-L-alanine amidase [Paracoccus sp. FO-3]
MSPSPNHGDRRGQQPSLVVIHYTGMADGPSARARLCDPGAEVSAHWLVHEDGTTEALVPEDRRAWHAGAGAWQGREDVNSRSIGIELVNPGDRPFPEPQMAALEALLGAIMARWSIPPQGVIAHSDMAPGRKIDPGPRFDWRRLALQGLAVWPEGPGPDLPLADSLARIGYPEDPARLAAFRLRFRPWADGPEDETDRRLAAALAYRGFLSCPNIPQGEAAAAAADGGREVPPQRSNKRS